MRAGISSRPISSNSSGMRLPRDHPRVSLGNAYGEDPDAGDDADALGHRDCAPGIEQVEEMRALEAKVIRSQHGKTALLGRSKLLRLLRGPAQQMLALRLVEAQMLPQLLYIGLLEVVDRELHLLQMANLPVSDRMGSARPDHVIKGVDILQKGGDALQPIGDFCRDGIEIEAATLLEVSELGDLQAIQHDLPADAPSPQCGRVPIVFFKLEVVLAQVNADGDEGFQVDLLHIGRWGLKHHLKLSVFEEPVGILPVTA